MKKSVQNHNNHRIRSLSLWLLVLALALPVTGCGSSSSGLGGSSQTLDIDYVGGDGEVTEEEVAAKKESPMDWLKQKLSGDKKKAGDYLTFKILRDGETMEVQVRLMEDSADKPK